MRVQHQNARAALFEKLQEVFAISTQECAGSWIGRPGTR